MNLPDLPPRAPTASNWWCRWFGHAGLWPVRHDYQPDGRFKEEWVCLRCEDVVIPMHRGEYKLSLRDLQRRTDTLDEWSADE